MLPLSPIPSQSRKRAAMDPRWAANRPNSVNVTSFSNSRPPPSALDEVIETFNETAEKRRRLRESLLEVPRRLFGENSLAAYVNEYTLIASSYYENRQQLLDVRAKIAVNHPEIMPFLDKWVQDNKWVLQNDVATDPPSATNVHYEQDNQIARENMNYSIRRVKEEEPEHSEERAIFAEHEVKREDVGGTRQEEKREKNKTHFLLMHVERTRRGVIEPDEIAQIVRHQLKTTIAPEDISNVQILRSRMADSDEKLFTFDLVGRSRLASRSEKGRGGRTRWMVEVEDESSDAHLLAEYLCAFSQVLSDCFPDCTFVPKRRTILKKTGTREEIFTLATLHGHPFLEKSTMAKRMMSKRALVQLEAKLRI